MKSILVLGGTQFVGRQVVEQLSQTEGLNLTMVHRGKTNPDLFPQVEHVLLDRNTDDMTQLASRDWDVVIDFSCYYPRPLRTFLEALNGCAGQYIFISTVSVYDQEAIGPGETITEDSPILSCSPEQEVDTTMYTYGQKKVACEEALLKHSDLNPLILRPGLIYGKYDPTDRFYYWLWRYHQAEKMLYPEVLEQPLQWTYANDFAHLILRQALYAPELPLSVYQTLTHGVFTFKEFMSRLGLFFKRSPETLPISDPEMETRELHYWQDFPLTLPEERVFDVQSLSDFQMEFVSFEQSLKETCEYYQSLNWPEPKTGIKHDAELAIFQELKS